MLMRAVFASAMLIGVAGTAQAEIKIIYPPYSYQAPVNLCDYVLGGTEGCGCHHGYGYRHHRYDKMSAAALPGDARAKAATVALILPPALDQ